MTDKEREEYEKLQDYFLQRDGRVTSMKKIRRLNELGKMSVEDRRRKNLTDFDFEWEWDLA